MTKERIALGKLLYFDKRLSSTGKISCASCHALEKGWSDALPKAVGVKGRKGSRNSPTILNTAYGHRQFWDGRARSLEEQALGPIQASVEMDMSLDDLEEVINSIVGYRTLFQEAYPNEPITANTIAKAIASFERTIVSTESAFDRFVQGDKNAISAKAQKGFDLFSGKAACISCHDGFNFSDGSFHNIGLGDDDIGRYKMRKRRAWFHAFKVPTLRDISKSAPYFHDGSAKTLKEAVTICAQGGREKSDFVSPLMIDTKINTQEIEKIVTFLETLSGAPLSIKTPTKFPN